MNIGYGCVKLSTCKTQSEALRLLRVTFDSGIRWFDTAPLYGQGYSEVLFGKFYSDLPPADQQEVKVVTKYGLGPSISPRLHSKVALPLNHLRKRLIAQQPQSSSFVSQSVLSTRHVSIEEVRNQFESSLRRLKVERIFGYLGHELVEQFLSDEIKDFLTSKVRSGEILHLGFGTGAKSFDHWMEKGESSWGWDILQYDAASEEVLASVKMKGRGKIHVHHSIFKGVSGNGDELLSAHLKAHPDAVILFSSSNPDRIRGNIQKALKNGLI